MTLAVLVHRAISAARTGGAGMVGRATQLAGFAGPRADASARGLVGWDRACATLAGVLRRVGASISVKWNALAVGWPRGTSRGRVRTGMCAHEPQGWRLGVPREAPLGRPAASADVARKMLALALSLAALASASAAHAELYYVIVGGLGGEPKYQEQFDKEVQQLAVVARRTAGDERVAVLSGEGATRAALTKLLGSLKTKTKATDSLALILVGHGSFDGEQYKLNLPGPDITGDELLKLLTAIPARNQLVVDTTSASGALLDKFVASGRTVITATRSGFERNATRFAEQWAKALADGSADVNKNGVITAQEAFDYASREVADGFSKAGTLATEHPQLKGDGAARFVVARLQSAPLPATPELAALDKQKSSLEDKIEDLRQRRPTMAPDAYLNELQTLLVQLAEVQRKIDEAQKAQKE